MKQEKITIPQAHRVVDIVSRVFLHRQMPKIAALAGMTDSEFLARVDELRAEKSLHFRAVCAQRWAKLTYPDDYQARESDAWLIWGERKTI